VRLDFVTSRRDPDAIPVFNESLRFSRMRAGWWVALRIRHALWLEQPFSITPDDK
jgi:hypothetical protein